MWRVSDLVECLIFLALALMLVYTALVTVRSFRRYFLACREFSSLVPDFAPASERSRKNLVAELCRGAGTLQSIASAAPFLELAGTCYGILSALFRGYEGSRNSPLAAISAGMAAALVTTVAGLFVATSAAVSYNVLRTRLENLGSRLNVLLQPRADSFRTLLLQKRFSGLPPFALIGAPVLALLIPLFLAFQRFQIPMGFFVRPLKIALSDHNSLAIVISVIRVNATGPTFVYVNSKQTPWDELGAVVLSQLRVHPNGIVYVEAGNIVPWADVMNAIDAVQGLQTDVTLLTVAPKINSSHLSGAKSKVKLEEM
jgi:hypothetical protein